MENLDQPPEDTPMDQHNRRIVDQCNSDCSIVVPLGTESLIDIGSWLQMDGDTSSPGINQRICKKGLVSLHVTLEDSENGCNLTPYCKNHPIRKCLKDQERRKEQNNAFEISRDKRC